MFRRVASHSRPWCSSVGLELWGTGLGSFQGWGSTTFILLRLVSHFGVVLLCAPRVMGTTGTEAVVDGHSHACQRECTPHKACLSSEQKRDNTRSLHASSWQPWWYVERCGHLRRKQLAVPPLSRAGSGWLCDPMLCSLQQDLALRLKDRV